MDTPKETVWKALRFQSPQRIPRDLWWQVWTEDTYPEDLAEILERYPSDFVTPDHKAPAGDRSLYRIGRHTDLWGCTFENIQDGVFGEVKDPLVQSWSDLDKVRPPQKFIDDGLQWIRDAQGKDDHFTIKMFDAVFERMQFLRGTEQLLIDMVEQPRGFFELRDRVHEFNCSTVDAWVRTDIDALSFNDDWGSQTSLLVSPELWRSLFKHLYREYADAVHGAGKLIFMHSDGHIFDILGDLVEIGIDAINAQLFCMDIEEIGRRFRGKTTFWGEIDRQHVLGSANPDDVRQAVVRLERALYDPRGGLIAQAQFGPGARPRNVQAVFETWKDLESGRSPSRRSPSVRY